MKFNTKWINRTANKDARLPSERYRAVVWHETQNGSGVAENTLNWNLKPTVGTSYDFLIGRDGTIYQYLDYHAYTSWDTGVSEWTIDGTFYRDHALNSVTLGIELDGPCDGTPVTTAQIEAAAKLAIFLRDTEGIPLDRAHHLTHAEIARKRTTNLRTDPRGTTPEQILEAAAAILARRVDYAKLWGLLPYRADWGIPSRWRQAYADGEHLGEARSMETLLVDGRMLQAFEHGAIVWSKDGTTEVWR